MSGKPHAVQIFLFTAGRLVAFALLEGLLWSFADPLAATAPYMLVFVIQIVAVEAIRS